MWTRCAGTAIVLASVAAMVVLRLLVTASPDDDPASTTELLLAAFVLTGLPGIGMLVEGPALFGPVDRPRGR